MEIYKCKIYINTPNRYTKHYYWNLWSFTHLLGNDFYQNIIAISPLIKSSNNYFFFITVKWKDSFTYITNKILQKDLYIDINNEKILIQSIDYWFTIYKPNNFFETFKSIEIHFLSPTIVKKEILWIDINQLLPTPEVYLRSCIRKYIHAFNKDINLEIIKKELKQKIIVCSFNIHTEKIKIKNNYKAGVVGNIKYSILQKLEDNTLNILYESLQYAWVAGIWTGTKLWLWQVTIIFNK